MTKQIILYLPVIHAGYLNMLRKHADANEILILGEGFANQFPWMKKEIRALKPQDAATSLQVHLGHVAIRVIEPGELSGAIWASNLVLPDEEVSRGLVENYQLSATTITYSPTFLRWDRAWSLAQQPVEPDAVVSERKLDEHFLGLARLEAQSSSDWWRQVGAVATLDDMVIFSGHNQHLPTDYSPYINGDPRNSFKRGVHAQLSTAIHAEAAIIGRAAREGISLNGASLYVTTFPCPPCARLIAAAGFTACYYAGPYAVLDGKEVLRQAGVKLIWVK